MVTIHRGVAVVAALDVKAVESGSEALVRVESDVAVKNCVLEYVGIGRVDDEDGDRFVVKPDYTIPARVRTGVNDDFVACNCRVDRFLDIFIFHRDMYLAGVINVKNYVY